MTTELANGSGGPGPGRMFLRALGLRCPNCGTGRVFRHWVRMLRACPGCGLLFERGESGYVVGAYMFNIVAAELIFTALALSLVVVTWPAPPWDLLLYLGVALMVALPVVCYPFSKLLFLAFDLTFRPAGKEGDGPGAAALKPQRGS